MLTGVQAKIVPATLQNDAGIVGAAMAAAGVAAAAANGLLRHPGAPARSAGAPAFLRAVRRPAPVPPYPAD